MDPHNARPTKNTKQHRNNLVVPVPAFDLWSSRETTRLSSNKKIKSRYTEMVMV